jgi:hypothetical protein
MGFQSLAKDDFENMRVQFPLYDALYRYCQLKVQGLNQAVSHVGLRIFSRLN